METNQCSGTQLLKNVINAQIIVGHAITTNPPRTLPAMSVILGIRWIITLKETIFAKRLTALTWLGNSFFRVRMIPATIAASAAKAAILGINAANALVTSRLLCHTTKDLTPGISLHVTLIALRDTILTWILWAAYLVLVTVATAMITHHVFNAMMDISEMRITSWTILTIPIQLQILQSYLLLFVVHVLTPTAHTVLSHTTTSSITSLIQQTQVVFTVTLAKKATWLTGNRKVCVCLLQNAQLASSLINIFTDVKDVNLKDAQNVHKQVDALSVQTPSLSLQTRHANTNVTELDNSTIQWVEPVHHAKISLRVDASNVQITTHVTSANLDTLSSSTWLQILPHASSARITAWHVMLEPMRLDK
jgi:hypothetical protein